MSTRRTLYNGWIRFKFACLVSILITTLGLAQTKTAPVSPQTATNSTQASYDRNLFWDLATGKKKDQATLEALTAIAQAGNARAQYDLGVLYTGLAGFPKDLTKAAYWFRRAADQGHPAAQFSLGVKYADGEGVPRDAAIAEYWFQQAADQDSSFAVMAGQKYDQGVGIPQDYTTAFHWYEIAAIKGDVAGQFIVGQMYFTGQGVTQDYNAAVKWTLLAAEREHTDAMHNLSIAYENGFGVPQNYTIAHMWENLAAARNPQYAKDRDALARKMTAAQVAEAQKLASEWKPKK